MSASHHIRLSTPTDRDAILFFIQQSGFNPRDSITWDGLTMQAMTAWDGSTLIGAIPFEPRTVSIGDGQSIRTIHETVVAVDPAHRATGIGSKMQDAIFAQPPMDAELVTVFREDPQSPAYRWYQKNKFVPVMPIHAWFCGQPIASGESPKLWNADDAGLPWFRFDGKQSAGRVIRKLQTWLTVHPYRHRYSFWFVTDSADSIALIGVGTMHSQTERVDVLDMVAPDVQAMRNLLNAISTIAFHKGWAPIRVPLAHGDPSVELMRAMRFQSRWSFDMLARPTRPERTANEWDFSTWRYAGIDYI